MLNIALICCDDRMIQIYDNLSKSFCVTPIYNMNDLKTCINNIDVLVLSVKGVDDVGHITGLHHELDLWKELHKDCIIFCGLRNDFLEKLPYRKIYYMEDQGVIHDNAILTAEGVLNELLSCCSKSIYDIQVDIIGYGNCGKVIYEMLHNLQVDVRVIRRKCKQEPNFIEIKDWKECGDIIINTSIQKVLDNKRMCSWNKRPVIIDIATPDVIDVLAAEKLGIWVIKASNLPARFACITAGNIIAEFIRGKLCNEG